jgi:hypothetical protein
MIMILTLGVFAALIAILPGDMIANQPNYLSPLTRDQRVVSYFSANNLTLYQNTWSFSISHGSSGTQVQNQSGLPDGHYLQVRWGGFTNDPIQFRHAFPNWLFGWAGVLDYHNLRLTDKYVSILSPTNSYYTSGFPYIYKEQLLMIAQGGNTSTLEVYCEHIQVTFVVMPTDTNKTLEQAWNADNLTFLMSYGIDFDAMKPSAFTLIGQLITFQAPDLGIPGQFGDFLTYVFAISFWVVVAIIIYTITTRLIPTIRGGVED